MNINCQVNAALAHTPVHTLLLSMRYAFTFPQAAEKGSMSGASTGSTTPPPMQDTAACSVSSNASVLSAPSLERSGQSHPQLSHTSSLSPVTARRHLSSGQLRRIQHAPPRRSTTASALSAENGSHSMEAMSRRTSLPVSPSHRPSLTPDSMTVDDEVRQSLRASRVDPPTEL